MAEFVQQSLEEMLPELRFMSQISLFTTCETDEILRRRTQFEYRLVRRQKDKADYLQYIQYELNLIALWNLRLKKTGYSLSKMSKQHISAISMRVNRLFARVTQRFADDLQLWLSYAQFCKHLGWDTKVSEIFFTTLKHHNENENLWMMAARWEIESRLDFGSSRTLLHRALRFHPKSKFIWLECFWLELAHSIEAKNRRSILTDSVADHETTTEKQQKHSKAAEIVFENARSCFPNEPLFWLSFAKQITKTENKDSEFTDLLNLVIHHVEQFSDDGHVQGQLIKFKNCIEEPNGNELDMYTSALVEFDAAVQCRPHCEALRIEYADFCVSIAEKLADNPEFYSKIYQRLVCFTEWLISHSSLTSLSEFLLISLIDFSVNSGLHENAKNLIDLAFKHLEMKDCDFSAFPFWHRRITLDIAQGLTPKIHDFFKRSMESSMPDDQVMKLCGTILSALISNGDKDKALDLLESAFKSFHKRDLPIRECFIRLKAGDASSIQSLLNREYQRLADIRPYRFRFYQTVIDVLLEFEACGGEISWSMLSRVLEDAVSKTGHEEPRSWLLYIELDGRFNDYKLSSELNWRALKCLDKEKVETFVEGLAKYKSCEGVIF